MTAYSKVWTISNASLEIQFNDKTALLTVRDKRCNKLWQQLAYKDQLNVGSVTQKGSSLIVGFTGKYVIEVNFTLTATSVLEVSLTGNGQMPFEDLAFPSAFAAPNKNHYVLMTDAEGLLLPVDDKAYTMNNERIFYCGGGMVMPWMGVTDDQFKTGYMAILETPYDATFRTKRENGFVIFEPVWYPTKGNFGYTRKLSYHFFDKGGYTAQCKTYRKYAWKKNKVITLKEKQNRFPAIEKMIGSPHIYVWDNAREVNFAKEMKSAGIGKAFILWDANHVPYPETGYDIRLKEIGYASGVYELFSDLKLPDTIMRNFDETGPMRFSRTSYPGLFNQLVTRAKTGKTYSNQFGHTSCPSVIRPEMTKRIERELKEFPHESYFLDVYQANGLFECYSTEHPLTRQQFAEEIVKNFKFIEDKYNTYQGGEWGADFTGSSSIYNHGMMTLQGPLWSGNPKNRATIYAAGDWSNNARPSAMIGTRVAHNKYLKYGVSEYLRVPLFELIYHDAIVSSWRWEDGNQSAPEIWWKKDLFNILYGTAPLWSLDRSLWEKYKNTFIESYHNVCPWLQQIGYDELISHRFVTADHKVQETVFSSGKKAVVNFGDEDYTYGDKILQAKGFLLIN
ncbi:MAG: hypothetical protein H7Z13_17400 [Ferruginibacter sp.]|nr:hypothetical protein [Ferruginibacter sp.]